MTTELVFDIETIPAQVSEADKPTIEAMAKKREQDPEMFQALCPALARVVVVGMLSVRTGEARVVYDESLLGDGGCAGCVDYQLIPASSEADLLTHVHKMIQHFDRLVTYGGRGFDIPTLIHRSVIVGINPAPILLRAAWQKPWEDQPHVDVLNQLTFGGATGRYSLAAHAIAHWLPNPKAGGDGSQVAGLVKEKKAEELIRYCMGDVKTTAELWKRWQKHTTLS